jgi:hypothetical protein
MHKTMLPMTTVSLPYSSVVKPFNLTWFTRGQDSRFKDTMVEELFAVDQAGHFVKVMH